MHRDSKRQGISVPVQVPLIGRQPTNPSANVIVRPDDVATLVPVKAGVRAVTADVKAQSARTLVAKDASLPVDEDQFDIPTFLRRAGHTELP